MDISKASDLKGLSENEALKRLQEEGYNELPSSGKRGMANICIEIIKEPMFLLLVACGAIYMFLGDLEEALLLMGFVFVVIGITIYQENKTERALDALKDLSRPKALVIRGGVRRNIPSKDIVRGDLIVLSEGDRIPADAVLISGSNILVDESLLTGESVPVRKAVSDKPIDMGPPGGEDLPFVYSGTLVVRGNGIALVKETGLYTEIGKIGRSLQQIETEKTQLQKETQDIVKKLAIGGGLLCVIVVALYFLRSGDLIGGLLAGITLAMSILPEEFPVVLTIFLALGAWRMSHKKVLARKQHAIQALGSTTVLCVDKTGTLTENKMSLKKLFANGKSLALASNPKLAEDFHELVEFGFLASHKDPFDPMEISLKDVGLKNLSNTEHLHSDWDFIHEYPLSKQLLAVSNVWKSKDKTGYVIAAKGAPEAIGSLCHLKEKEMDEIMAKVGEMADNGLRVLGVAKACLNESPLPSQQHDFEFEFLGLLGFIDPVKKTVAQAISECNTAGIRVVMITGDYPGTAKHIAKQIGLVSNGGVITGSELNEMSDNELEKRIADVNIFARVVPEQKLKIVNALKARGEIVAMTGDGVNDAPALKSAHIGISMGGHGTDVAREASSVVILDDDFSSIVQGVGEGRHIFDNIRKAMSYILAVHIPIAGITFLAVLLGWPMLLLPVHIVFLELIIDPACSVVFEREKAEANLMNRPPRSVKEKIFDRKSVTASILQGLGALLLVALVFQWSVTSGRSEETARALSFCVLIFSSLGLILANRSWNQSLKKTILSENNTFWWISIGALAFLAATLYIPFLSSLFKFGPIGQADILIAIGAGVLSLVWFEALKWVFRK